MTNTKRILITTESREFFFVRLNGKRNIRGFCPNCAAEVEMLTLDEAVSFSARNTRELFRQIESGAIHSIETANGHLIVCQNSLKDLLQGAEK